MKKLASVLAIAVVLAACSKTTPSTAPVAASDASAASAPAATAASAVAASTAAAAAEMAKPRPATFDANLKPAPVVRRIELNAGGGAPKAHAASEATPTIQLHNIPASAALAASAAK